MHANHWYMSPFFVTGKVKLLNWGWRVFLRLRLSISISSRSPSRKVDFTAKFLTCITFPSLLKLHCSSEMRHAVKIAPSFFIRGSAPFPGAHFFCARAEYVLYAFTKTLKNGMDVLVNDGSSCRVQSTHLCIVSCIITARFSFQLSTTLWTSFGSFS